MFKMKYKILLIIIIMSSFLNGFIFDMEKKDVPKFNLQCYVKPGNSIKKGVLEVKVVIPNKELLFIKEENIYRNKFDISINISQKNKRIIGKNWIKTIDLNNFESTKATSQNITINEQFSLLPEKYTVTVVITDLATQNIWKKEKKVDMTILKTDLWVQSELYLYDKTQPDSSEQAKKDEICVAFTALGKAGEQKFRYYIYQAGNEKPIEKGIYRINLIKARKEYVIKVNIQKFKHSKYKMKLITKINDITFSRSVEFQVSYENLSPVITNIDDAIKQMKYLIMTSFITRKEYKEINNARDDKKRELYLQFWKSVDPTPRTKENEIMNEYYQRINLANQSFASHNNGWKTDRGMVLTIFGHPDDVENHSFEMDRKPYIIWYYHRINRSFVFVDYTGFGSYQLSQPLFDFSY